MYTVHCTVYSVRCTLYIHRTTSNVVASLLHTNSYLCIALIQEYNMNNYIFDQHLINLISISGLVNSSPVTSMLLSSSYYIIINCTLYKQCKDHGVHSNRC